MTLLDAFVPEGANDTPTPKLDLLVNDFFVVCLIESCI